MNSNFFSDGTNKKQNINELSPLALAFVGDAVHTLFVRTNVVNAGIFKLNNYHKNASQFCKASAQSEMLDLIKDKLTEDEQNIVRRARNAKNHHVAKSADEQTYKKSTAFEALIGYLYLKEDFKRLSEILKGE